MASIPKPVSDDEKRWQAESDASALKKYAEIQTDAKRKQAAEKMIAEEIKKSQMVLDQQTQKTTTKKESVKKTTPKKESGNSTTSKKDSTNKSKAPKKSNKKK